MKEQQIMNQELAACISGFIRLEIMILFNSLALNLVHDHPAISRALQKTIDEAHREYKENLRKAAQSGQIN